MPETFGKRQRQAVKARKAAAREDRRVARNERREAKSDDVDDMSWLAEPNPEGPPAFDPRPSRRGDSGGDRSSDG